MLSSPESADQFGAKSERIPSPIELAVRGLLIRHGVSSPHQAKEISQILGLSDKQVRRKLVSDGWTVLELQLLVRHYGEGLASLFKPASTPLPMQDARLLVDGREWPCSVRVGRMTGAVGDGAGLVCVRRESDGVWLVGSGPTLDKAGTPRLRYGVESIEFQSNITPLRIAVVDDDETSAAVLADFFNEEGHRAQAYTDPRALSDQALREFDAFVVDWILSSPSGKRETCQHFVEKVRGISPQAKVVLLTGKLRQSPSIESELTQAMHSLGVTNLLEKPARPKLVLTTVMG